LVAPLAANPQQERLLTALEHRVQMLENTVAVLQDTRQLEQRITERVVTRLPPAPEPPPRDIALPGVGAFQTAVQSSWLVLDLLAEGRAMFVMLFDRRYNMAWLARVAAIVLLVALFTSGWWFAFSWLPLGGGFLGKLLDLFLALLLFLLLNRESRRYREWRAGRR
jgi:hypothetical protein